MTSMFGLMRHAPRLPYCGTCKTLGTLYGQRSRLLLNHDTVFLAEVLLELAGGPKLTEKEWLPAYQSFNCLKLPRRAECMPLALEYAATMTVVLAHFQIEDHLVDSGGFRWRAAARLFSPAYWKAARRLREWRFPLDEMTAILRTQAAREAHPRSLEQVAEPTAAATALALRHGVRLCGRPDLEQAAYELGVKFGRLIYVLDAYQDRERDTETGAFNALLAFPDLDARREVMTAAGRIAEKLSATLANRLRANVEERLGLRLPIVHLCARVGARQRLRDAVAFARSLRERESTGLIKGAAVLATVALLAFVFPHHARRAESWQQCLGVPFNLMALSSIFAFAAQPPPAPGPVIRPAQLPPNLGSCRSCLGPCAESCGEGLCESACDSCDCS